MTYMSTSPMARWHASPPRSTSRPPRVIVADDDDDLRALIVTALRGAGYQPVAVKSGAELLDQMSDALLSGEPSRGPDLIITDVRMPGLTGLGILLGARQAHWPGSFILMTAYPDPHIREEAERCGAVFFSKPFEIDDLVTAVLNLAPPGKVRSTVPPPRPATPRVAR